MSNKPRSQKPRNSGVFISYRREDSSGYAGRLYDALRGRLGVYRVFRDIDTIKPGDDFSTVIENSIASCGFLVAIIGKQWLNAATGESRRLDDPKDFVRREIAAALTQGVRVIPVLVQGANMPKAEYLPEEIRPLANIQAIEISDARWDHDVTELIRALKADENLKRYVYFAVAIITLVLLAWWVIKLNKTPAPAEPVNPTEASSPQESVDQPAGAEIRGNASASTPFVALVAVPQTINSDLTPAQQTTLMEVFGEPCGLTPECSQITNPKVSGLLVTESIGPFTVKGIKPAVEALHRIFNQVKEQSPELYEQIQIGSAGMICCRKLRGGSGFSNHSWGTAIDIQIRGTMDIIGDRQSQVGLLYLYPFFHKEKFYWGAGSKQEDSMHFEASDELLREWHRNGSLTP
jgi:hypothetical protein